MKNIVYILLSLVIFNACSTKDNLEKEFIIITNSTDTITQKASLQIQEYWKKITNRSITISNQEEKGKTSIFIGKQYLQISDSLEISKYDAFQIVIKTDSIILAGKNPIGDLYATNTFLEEHFGCMKLSSTEDYIPQKNHIQFKISNKIYNPAFEFRRVHSLGQWNQKYREWYKTENLDDWGMFVHTFHKLIPPSKYFDDHPEYFSLVNGKRLKDAQLCLSNKNVVDLLIENLGIEIKKQPNKMYWSVSQTDTYNPCECDNCNKEYKKHGGFSGAYINMTNKIAEAYPNKQISTLAYQFTRSAPTNIKPLPNVNIMFCSIECNRSMPLSKDPRSKSFVKDMTDWSNLTNNIFLWDYVVQFKNYLTPFPNFTVLQPNIQFFNENNVDMMFQQASGGSWSDLIELKQYLIAKSLWNPEVNIDSLTNKFIETYYGDASQYIKQYFDLMHNKIGEYSKTEVLNIYGFPSDYTDSYLAPSLMIQYKSFMDNAENAVSRDSILLKRVKRARLPVDFAYVDIMINNDFKEMPSIIQTKNRKTINPILLKLLTTLEETSSSDPSIKINERNFKIPAYKEYVLNKLNYKIKPNKLSNTKIELKTKYSVKYPANGIKTFNDNLFGGFDFHKNWLGFEKEDVIIEIDFRKPISISEIQMNFMKAVNSWIFLPQSITIETSFDGINYKKFKSIRNDNKDQNYLVKSIPFTFNFDPIEIQYLRIKAESIKTCPEWHRGFGKPSWIFIDEIIVN